jgi:hypothetical protein
MSGTYRQQPNREAISVGSAWAAGQAGDPHVGEAGDVIACLDVLAAHMQAHGWTACINPPAGRPSSLFVQDPHDHTACGDIMATPGNTTGDWWYWFSWAERIGPVHAPAAAADTIIAALQRAPDNSLTGDP